MKPSFALSLSSTGITLLHRASGGWRNVGTVTFDSADLDADLAALREKGLEFESPMRCKLILPNDQIRYLTLETGDISDETRRAEMRLALADATPYELHELSFDISADGPRTHAAAVAYETLQEAEHFAQMHGFGPTSFVAQPDAEAYLGEPFFGVADAMNGAEVTPDGIAVVDIGPAILPEPEIEPTPEEPVEEAPAVEAVAEADQNDATEDAPEAEEAKAATQETPSEDKEQAASELEDELAPQSDMSDAEAKALADASAKAEPVKPKAAQASPGPTIEEVTAQLSARAAQALARDDLPDKVSPQEPTGLPEALDFGAVAKITSDSITPEPTQKESTKDSAAKDTSSDIPAPAAPVQPAPASDTEQTPAAAPTIGFSSRRTPAAANAARELGAQSRSSSSERPASRIPTLSAVRATPSPERAAPAAVKAAAAPTAPKPAPTAPEAPAPTAIAARTSPSAAADAAPSEPAGNVLAQIKPKKIAVPANSPAAKEAAAARAAYEADKTAETKPRKGAMARVVGGKPRYLGLMLTSLLLLFMAVVAAVAFWSDARFDDSDPAFDSQPAPAALSDSIAPDEAVEDVLQETPAQNDPTATDGSTPETAPLLSDATTTPTEPSTPEATASLAPSDTPTDAPLTSTDTAVLDALQDEALAAARPEPLETDTLPDDTADLLTDPEAAGDDIAFLDPLSAPDVAALDHLTTYAATGIWQQVPQALSDETTTSTADLDNIYVASIDKSELSHDAIALPSQDRFATDLIQNALSSPVPADSEFDLDERGLVSATPEGTLNPDGIMVFLGQPAKVPPTRPAFAPEPEVPVQPAIASIRPRPRPADLQDRAERARLGGLNLEELSQKRPRVRPTGLALPTQTELAQDSPEEDTPSEPVQLAALPPATAQAIGSSVIPRARPANFAALAARARTTAQSAPEAPARAVQQAATVAPSVPSSASVAREATVANVLDLRKLNLIGISGSASNRQALVRMPSGRIRRVKVGDNIDGGRVTAIDSERLLYQKRGRNHTLRLPNG